MAKGNSAKIPKSNISYDILEIYGYLSKKEDKVLVKISWNGGEPRNEIRRCWKDKDTGELRLGKGIDITDDEFDELIGLMKKRPKPVDFGKIFESSEGIMDKRAAGFRTEDGFVVLRKRNRR